MSEEIEFIDTMGMDSKDGEKKSSEEARIFVAEQRIIFDIEAEVRRQDKQWGANRHKPMQEWIVIIGEEYGEMSRAILENKWAPSKELYEETVQVAALALQMLKDIRYQVGERGLK